MQTSIDEWRAVAVGAQPSWEWRARIIAKLIRSTDTVLDIGAGDQKLKRFIPPSCIYIPVDCVDDLPGTFVVDFNKEFRLPDVPFTVAVCAGSLEYINDLAGFFRSFAEEASGRQVIFSYLLAAAKLSRDRMKVYNSFTNTDDLLNSISFAFSHIEIVAQHRDTVFFSAALSSSDEKKWINRQPINDILATSQPKSAIGHFLAKTGRSIRKKLRRRLKALAAGFFVKEVP
jgi:hypothetical protein